MVGKFLWCYDVEQYLFSDIAWSTSRVYGQTLARAREENLAVKKLAILQDVDEPSDLACLAAPFLAYII